MPPLLFGKDGCVLLQKNQVHKCATQQLML